MGSKIQLLASVIQFAAHRCLTLRLGVASAVKDAGCPPEPRRPWEKPLTLTLSRGERRHGSRADSEKVA